MPTFDLGSVVGPQGPQGATGPQGPQGPTGPQGPKGEDGTSAYEAAVSAGYTGSEQEFNSALATSYDPAGSAEKVQNALDAHIADKANPHGVTAAQVGAIPASQKGVAGGVASLGSDGKVPAGQLPDMNYEAAGTAASTVNAHNANATAHQNLKISFTEAPQRANIYDGLSLAACLGKIKKWFADMKSAAFCESADFAGATHAAQHASGGSDPVTPAAIGAAASNHNHAGQSINPSSIEIIPSTSAGHGGYIDFHFNGDAADYTSRIFEPVKGVLEYNGHGILSTANIVALLNVQITFTDGVATYENSAIKSSSVTFVQWRSGAVSTLTDSVLSTTPQNGSMKIIAKKGITGGPLPVNILIINL